MEDLEKYGIYRPCKILLRTQISKFCIPRDPTVLNIASIRENAGRQTLQVQVTRNKSNDARETGSRA